MRLDTSIETRQKLRKNEAEVHERGGNRRNSYFRPAPEPTTAVTMVDEGVA